MSLRRISVTVASVALIASLTACSSGSEDTGTAPKASSCVSGVKTSGTTDVTTTLNADQVTAATANDVMTVTFPAPATTQQLSQKDVTVGSGTAAELNKSVTVNYCMLSAKDGKVLDNGAGVDLTLAEDSLIEGWVQGMPGMKVGGRRILVIPADLAYGNDGSGGRPSGTLVFVLDLLKVS